MQPSSVSREHHISHSISSESFTHSELWYPTHISSHYFNRNTVIITFALMWSKFGTSNSYRKKYSTHRLKSRKSTSAPWCIVVPDAHLQVLMCSYQMQQVCVRPSTFYLSAGVNGISAGTSIAWLRHCWCKVYHVYVEIFSAVNGTS